MKCANHSSSYRTLDLLVVISLHSPSGRNLLNGLFSYLTDDFRWRLHILEPERFTAAEVLNRRYDGFVVTMPGTKEAMSALVKSDRPTVLVNIDDRRLSAREGNISFVWLDNNDIGRLAAEHLLHLSRFKSFGFIFSHENDFYNRERESAFRLTLQANGLASSAFHPSDANKRNKEMIRWLKDLPKPAGIMASTDLQGIEALAACEKAGLDVPNAVSILGVGDDLSRSTDLRPSLSSVNPNYSQVGYRAMQELDLIAHSRRCRRPKEVVIPAKGVVIRQSSTPSARTFDLVDSALSFITSHATDRIRPVDVATHLGCSLRLAEIRFRRIQNETIRAAIERIRIEKALELLKGGERTVKEASEHLNFTSPNQLSRIFKRHFGKTITMMISPMVSKQGPGVICASCTDKVRRRSSSASASPGSSRGRK